MIWKKFDDWSDKRIWLDKSKQGRVKQGRRRIILMVWKRKKRWRKEKRAEHCGIVAGLRGLWGTGR